MSVSGGTPGYTYTWIDCVTGNSIGITSATATGLCGGSYSVIVSDANGCSDTTACVNWTDPGCTMVSTTFGNTSSCSGSCTGTVTLATTNGTPPYYYIHPVSGNPITYSSTTVVTGLCAGTWTLVISDANGCTNTQVVTIQQSPAINATLTNNSNPTSSSSCNGSGTASVTGGAGGVTYYWINCSNGNPIGVTGATANNLCAGTYAVIVTDANGCSDTSACVTWTNPPCNLVSTVTNITNPTCNEGCDGSAVITTTNGMPPYTMNHPVTGTPMTYTSSMLVGGLCAGVWTFFVTDANGCTSVNVITLTQPSAVVAGTSNTINPTSQTSCDGSITATASGGTPGYVYTWIDCNTMSVIDNSPTVTNLCPGDYAVIATDVNGCSDTSACVTLSAPNGMEENETENLFSVYPNPSNGMITVNINSSINHATLLLTDITGKIIYTTKMVNNKMEIDLSTLITESGTYFVKMQNEDGIVTRRIIYIR